MNPVKKQHQSQTNWLQSEYGRSFMDAESVFTDKALRQIGGPRVLLIGDLFQTNKLLDLDFPQLLKVLPEQTKATVVGSSATPFTQVLADPAFLPFAPNTFSSVILPHVLEGHHLPHQVLREAHRVLRPEGCLLITGFNPLSLVSLQRFLLPKAALKGDYYRVKRVRDWLQLLGFEVVASAMYQYAPLCRNSRLRNALNYLNTVGNRWLPMCGAGYMISAKKREAGARMIGRVQFSSVERRRRKLATSHSTTASSSIMSSPSNSSAVANGNFSENLDQLANRSIDQ